jgi:hypothetical protein
MGFFSSPLGPRRFWDPPSLLTNGCGGLLFSRVKWPGREVDYSLPSNAEVKNVWRCKSTTPSRLDGMTLN